MIDLLLILFFFLIMYQAKLISPPDDFFSNYLALENTKPYRGILALIILFHHLAEWISTGIVFPIFEKLGYLATAVFFFYSGYGLIIRYGNGKFNAKEYIVKRIIKLSFFYIITAIIYFFYYHVIGESDTILDYLNNFIKTGDTFVPFSWYIIVILLYYFVYLMLKLIFKNNNKLILICSILLYFPYFLLLKKLDYNSFWYNSVFIVNFGMVWGLYEEKINQIVRNKYKLILFAILFIFIFFLNSSLLFMDYGYYSIIEKISRYINTVLFTCLVLLLSMKIKIGNKYLNYLGTISLEIYTMQGLSILIAGKLKLYSCDGLIYALFVIILTILLAYCLHYLYNKIIGNRTRVNQI